MDLQKAKGVVDKRIFIFVLVVTLAICSVFMLSTTKANEDVTVGVSSDNVEVVLSDETEALTRGDVSPFTKYSLTEYQLKSIASLCQQEQGNAQGAAAEASLMANHMDLRQGNAKKYPNTGEGLYNYVRLGKWFANAAKFMDDHSKLRSDVLTAVRKVLVEGKRTLPGYVNEHDCFSDITSATNNGVAINVKTRSAYIKNVTKVKNRYGATYIFYSFPTSSSDPFGYTSEAKRREIGDFCYNYADI